MEPKTITNFFNELAQKGVRKQNQFQVVITSGHNDIDAALENITMWASSSNLPGRQQVLGPDTECCCDSCTDQTGLRYQRQSE